jgi:hypothetical protein
MVTGTDGNGCTNTATTTVTVNPVPSAPLASGTTICAGTTATLTAGGTGTIGWYDAATLGTHIGSGASFTTPVLTSDATYYVQDSSAAGCASSRTAVTVTVNPLPIVALGTDITQCGGSVTLDAGNTALDHFWSDASTGQTLTVTTSGTYSVTVTDLATTCSATDAIVVTINTIPTVALGTDITQCGGSATLDAGNAGLDHLWSDASTGQTLTVTASGTYSVTVTDLATSCSATDAIVVTINTIPTVALGTDITQCGGSVTLDAGNAGLDHVWSDASTGQTLTVTASGTYSVTVTDLATSCSATDAIDVTINTIPTVSLTSFATSVCDNGGPVTLSGGSPAGGVYSGTGVTGSVFDPAVSGAGMFLITYTITDGTTSCSNTDTASITVDLCSGIADNSGFQGISVYPNPTSGIVKINVNKTNFSQLTISIIDIQGKEVYNETDKNISTEYNKEINLEKLAKGIYYIKLNTGNDSKVQKLIVH